MSTKGSPMTEKLKPCPFCGGEAKAITPTSGSAPYVLCVRCHAGGPVSSSSTMPEAITAWNTRPSVVFEGFKLVPVEPTEAMLDAGADEVWPGGSKPAYAFADARRVYAAMLLASQEG